MTDIDEIAQIIQLMDESEHGMISVHCASFEQMVKLEKEFRSRDFEAIRNVKQTGAGDQHKVIVSW